MQYKQSITKIKAYTVWEKNGIMSSDVCKKDLTTVCKKDLTSVCG